MRLLFRALSLFATVTGVAAMEPASQSLPRAVGQLVYDCPIPVGLEQEKQRRMDAYFADSNSVRDGWYATFPAPQRIGYAAQMPVELNLQSTPYLVGRLWGGRDYGDIVDRWMTCGHTMETHDWTVLLHAYEDGFATIDMREVLVDQPLPVAPGQREIAPHAYSFQIGDSKYQYVATSVGAGLVKVWRPDLVEVGSIPGTPKRSPDSSDPDTVWPVMDSFMGVLLVSNLPKGRWHTADGETVRDADAIAGGLVGDVLLEFGSGPRQQPVDIRGTPFYHGRFGGVGVDRPGRPDPEAPFLIAAQGEKLLFRPKGGEAVEIDLAGWFDRQVAEIVDHGGLAEVPITAPLVEFEYHGMAVKYVLDSVWTKTSIGEDGLVKFSIDRIGGDLFTAGPSF